AQWRARRRDLGVHARQGRQPGTDLRPRVRFRRGGFRRAHAGSRRADPALVDERSAARLREVQSADRERRTTLGSLLRRDCRSVGRLAGLELRLAIQVIRQELGEPVLNLRDEAALHPEGFLLALVRIQAAPQVELAALVLQIVNELVDRDVVLGGIGQVLPEKDDVGVLIYTADRVGTEVLD